MRQAGLSLHPQKTRIIYCQDDSRRDSYEHVEFTFLGFTFRERTAQARNGQMFRSFLPAISKQALKRISAEVRSWRLHLRTHLSEADLARRINPVVRGWMNYYGAFYKSALYPLLERINAYLMRFMRKKYQRLRGRKKAQDAWTRAVTRRPRFFAHWAWITYAPKVW
jgi:RNA-directed DNA polymerase